MSPTNVCYRIAGGGYGNRMIMPPNVQNQKASILDLTSCIQGDWVKCGVSFVKIVWKVFNWQKGGKVIILGYECDVKIKGRLSHFQLVWDGRVKCPFGQEATSKGWKSAKGAGENAAKEFFKKNSALIQSMGRT